MTRSVQILANQYGQYQNLSQLRSKLKEEGYSLFEWQDSPQAYYSPHQHPHDEYIVVVSGEIVFTIDDKDFKLTAGDALDLPAGTVHSSRNKGKASVVYFICTKNQ